MFSTSVTLQGFENGASCCHYRLMGEIVPLLDVEDRQCHNQVLDFRKVDEGLKSVAATVILLSSKNDVERYSVTSSCTVEFVTVFEIAKNSRKIVKCHSSICKTNEGSTHAINNLGKGVLCSHLKEFSKYYRLIQDIPESEDSSSDDEDRNAYVVDNDGDDTLLPQEKVDKLLLVVHEAPACVYNS